MAKKEAVKKEVCKKAKVKAVSLGNGAENVALTKQINDALKGKKLLGVLGGNLIVE